MRATAASSGPCSTGTRRPSTSTSASGPSPWTAGRPTGSPATPSPRWPGRQAESDALASTLRMERFGLVGLPNAGKSSLFNALTGGDAPVAAHPYSTTETNIGVASVPDSRVDALAEMSRSKKVVHATAEIVDIAGLQKGSSQGEGLGNRFLGGLREVDAICYVLRAFRDDNVPGEADPVDDLTTLELELVLADAASAESQLDKRRKAAKADKSLGAELGALERAVEHLQSATP